MMVWPALLGTSNRTSPAGPSNPRLAETSDFGQGYPNGGRKEPAVAVSIESARFVSHRRETRAERRRFDRLFEAPAL